MTKQIKKENKDKVNLRIKGDLRHLSYKLHALIKASRLGLKTNKLIKTQSGNLEFEFEGEKAQLWEIVRWTKGRKFLSNVSEVMFTFSSSITSTK